MDILTQPLHDEHQELLPEVDRILRVAEQVGHESPAMIRPAVDQVYEFLAFHLKPHAQAEEAALYPAVQKALASPESTRTMARDHIEIGRYIEELAILKAGLSNASWDDRQAASLRRILFGLYALVKLHFAKEEEVYLPILDQRLTPETAHQMFAAMESAAHQAKAGLHAN